jgi:uncharacterized protein (DUF488 family)
MDTRRPELFTIGHSTHSVDEFVGLLKQHGISAVADVRSQPYSRHLPHFNRENLSLQLIEAGVIYVFLGRELGARREESECYEGQKADYERIAFLPAFQAGLERLRVGANRYRLALMCAEKDPLDCHRTILVGRRLRNEFDIKHILSNGTVETQEQIDARLVRQMSVSRNLFEPRLSDDELVQRAYQVRAQQIAYQAADDRASP